MNRLHQEGATPAWLAIVIVLVVGFLAWLVWMMIRSPRIDTPARTEQSFSRPVPHDVRTYVGVVGALGDHSFTLMASADRNVSPEDTTVTVTVDEETEFIMSYPAHPSSGALVQRAPATFEDMHEGDQVSVTAGENVQNQNEFKATKVEIVR